MSYIQALTKIDLVLIEKEDADICPPDSKWIVISNE